MEKYSDTAKWRIKYIIGDDCADGLIPRAFSIYSTSTDEDDDNSYIRMDWIPGLSLSLIHISYFNVDYDNEENLENYECKIFRLSEQKDFPEILLNHLL